MNEPAALHIETHRGEAVHARLPAVAALRVSVFRDWPYLYDGDADYEAKYLATYARSPRSLFVLALDGDDVVGASTALPLADAEDAFRAPFAGRGLDVDSVFYFGESVLLPAYRGRGVGHRFFDERERYALSHEGVRYTAFCAVVRREDDPRRPPEHRPLGAFWRSRGYVHQTGMTCMLPWKEVGDAAPISHELAFWLRDWRGG